MSELTKDIPKGTLTKEETILYLYEIDNHFCIEPAVMRNAIYSACHYLDEESAKEPQECKNVSQLNDVDEFKCSECGIIMQDWTRKIVDEEDTYYSEYAFRYCPNCGRKIKVSNEHD